MTKTNAAKKVAATTTLHLVETPKAEPKSAPRLCGCGATIFNDKFTLCYQCSKNAEAEARGEKLQPCMNNCGRKTRMHFCVQCHKKLTEQFGSTYAVVRTWREKYPNDERFYKSSPPAAPAPKSVAKAEAPKPIVPALAPTAKMRPATSAPFVTVPAIVSIDDLDALLDEQLESADEYVMPRYTSYAEELETALEAKLADVEACDDIQPVDYGPVVKDIKGFLARYVVAGQDVPAKPAPARKLSPAEQKATEIRAEARKIFAENGIGKLLIAGAVAQDSDLVEVGGKRYTNPHFTVTFKGVRCDIFDPKCHKAIKAARKEVERLARAEKAERAEQSAARSRKPAEDEKSGRGKKGKCGKSDDGKKGRK
ncbi:MAG: hypothetical protein WCT54_01465 [Patescibacteria group bacterium]|jgi:hypothetical protein